MSIIRDDDEPHWVLTVLVIIVCAVVIHIAWELWR
jgi:hypothetical protein